MGKKLSMKGNNRITGRFEKPFAEMIQEEVTGIYLIVMLLIYPVFIVHGYIDLLYKKWDLFLYGSTVFVLLSLFFLTIAALGKRRRTGKEGKAVLSVTDGFVLLYFLCVLLSFFGAVDKKTALWGVDTWYMGLVSQLLFVGIYMGVSGGHVKTGYLKYLAGTVYLAVCGLLLLQRFRVDMFGLHTGLAEEVKLDFVTTMGQVTWTSSYISILLIAAMGIWFLTGASVKRWFCGGCVFVGFAALAVLNCDSGVIAVAAALLILIWMALESRERMLRLTELVMLASAAFITVGLLERIFPDRLIPIDEIYVIVAKSPLLYGLFLLAVCFYLLVGRNILPVGADRKALKVERGIYLALLGLGALGVILLFVLHGKGYFAGSPTENYFRFTVWWGNSRGFIWRTAGAVFGDFNLWRKLFGCGPDCFTPYAYGLMGDAINEFWHNQVVPNAHNEWLNAVINYGIIGGAAYLGIFVSASKRCLSEGKKRLSERPELFGIGLAAVGYITHNILCYQQLIGTPLIFILLGIGEAKMREGRKQR